MEFILDLYIDSIKIILYTVLGMGAFAGFVMLVDLIMGGEE